MKAQDLRKGDVFTQDGRAEITVLDDAVQHGDLADMVRVDVRHEADGGIGIRIFGRDQEVPYTRPGLKKTPMRAVCGPDSGVTAPEKVINGMAKAICYRALLQGSMPPGGGYTFEDYWENVLTPARRRLYREQADAAYLVLHSANLINENRDE